MKITVTGSLGHIGKPLTKSLVQQGHQVTVISSNPEKRGNIEASSATAAIGSVTDTAFLSSAFTGADAVFTMVPPNFGAPDMRAYYQEIAHAYATAIKAAGVQRVVNLSSYGADLDRGTGFILPAHDAEGILNALEGPYITHLRPGYFYYNLLAFTGMIQSAGMIGANYGGSDKLVMVAPEDIAMAAAEALTDTGSGNDVRYVASDDRTANEVAGVLGAAIGKPDLKWVTFTDEQAQSGMQHAGVPPYIAGLFVELGASIHSGALRKDYDLHRPATMGRIKLEDFAKEFAAAYQKNA